MAATSEHKEFRENFLASSLIGMSSLINLVIGMFRTKIIAMLLGPAGVGLMGLYTSIINTTSTISGMGLPNSGVRQLAEAAKSGNELRIALTVTLLRHAVWGTGAIGGIIMFCGAKHISQWTFGNSDYTVAIMCLSVVVLLGSISQGQRCILQGLRNIRAVAYINIWSAVFSTIISIPCYYFWGISGIVASLILGSSALLLTSWLYVRKMRIPRISVPRSERKTELTALFKLGFCFMASDFVFLGMNYVINAIITRRLGLDDFGLYQMAFSLTALLFNFIFNAMGTDFYPRLTALANNGPAMRHTVNQQCEICLLLSLPLVVGLIFFAPWAIRIFYTSKFMDAVLLIQIFAVASYVQMISFPVGYVMIAKGMGSFLIGKGIFNGLVNIGLCYYLVIRLGVAGAAWAYLLMYVVNTFINLFSAHIVAGVHWNRSTFLLTFISSFIVVVSFGIAYFIDDKVTYYISGFTIVFSSSFICLYILLHRLGLSLSDIVKLRFRKLD